MQAYLGQQDGTTHRGSILDPQRNVSKHSPTQKTMVNSSFSAAFVFYCILRAGKGRHETCISPQKRARSMS